MHSAHGKRAEDVASILALKDMTLMLHTDRPPVQTGMTNLASFVGVNMAHFKGEAHVLFFTPCAFVVKPATVPNFAGEHPLACISLSESIAVIHLKFLAPAAFNARTLRDLG